jgi:L-ascorbate metabolism protein UlaG (beta-lactamase superfamily)
VFSLTHVGGPTAILEYAGLRWLTDPSLSPPGEYEGGLVKTTGPALEAAGIGPIDVVLLSHEHHSDNLDPAGRAFLPSAGRVLTTEQGAERLGGNAVGLEPWSSFEIERGERDDDPARIADAGAVTVTSARTADAGAVTVTSARTADAGTVRVTAVPAQHGPDGTDHITGPVIGFILAGESLDTVYVSGDNASLDVVRSIAQRVGEVDIAILFAGAVQLARRFDGAYLTLSSDRAAEAAKILGARHVIPVHFEGWTHFTQGAEQLRAAFAGNQLADRLHVPERGETVTVGT